MNQKTFNWGIIAPGRIARTFAKGLSVIDDATLYAVASSDQSRAKAFADEFGGAEQVYGSYDELIADPKVDGIYIANPHRYHYDCVERCLNAGKPLLCEKPLTVTAAESERLFALAESNGVFLMEALWSRFLPVWQQVKQWLEAGLIGDVRVINCTFGFNIPRNTGDRLLNPELAGGVLLDMGVYCVAMSQFVMGRDPERILADGIVGETGVDERSSALLNYGGPVSMMTSNFKVQTVNNFVISGTHGSITVDAEFWAAKRATLTVDGEVTVFEGPFRASGFEYQTEEAMRCIRAGKLQSEVIPWRDTLGNMRTMDEMLTQIGVEYPFSPRS